MLLPLPCENNKSIELKISTFFSLFMMISEKEWCKYDFNFVTSPF